MAVAEVPGIGLAPVGPADGIGWVAFRTVAAITAPPGADAARLELLDGAARVPAWPADDPITFPGLGAAAGPPALAPLAPTADEPLLDLAPVQAGPAPPALRCAWCHDDVDAACVTCPACATRLHRECVVDRRCPTFGCRHPFTIGVGPARPAAPAPAPGRAGRAGRRAAWKVAGGALVPLVCFTANELIDPLSQVVHRAYGPALQRPLYPLLLWSVLALLAACAGRRAEWVRHGLRAGVALSGLFSLLFLPLVPLSVIGCVIGIGLLGFGPFAAFAAFRAAARDYAADGAPDRTGALAARIIVVPRA